MNSIMFMHLAFIYSLVLVAAVSAQLDEVAVIPVGGIDQVTGLVGEDYILRCEQTLRPTADDPAPDLRWSFETVAITDGGKYEITLKKNESAKYSMSALTIKNSELSDDGDYRCDGLGGGTTISLELSLELEILSSGEGFRIEEGLVLTCEAHANVTEGMISWEFSKDGTSEWKELPNGEQDLGGDSTKEVKVEGRMVTLLTSDVAATGTYRCSVDAVGGGTKQTGEAVVFANLEVVAPRSIKVSEKENGMMRCEVFGNPMPELIWAVNGTVYTKESESDKYEVKPIESKEGTVELHIMAVTIDDKYSNYTCTARLGEEEEVKEILLRIRDPLAALWPFIGIVSEVVILIVIILIHEACTKGEDIGETDDEEEDQLLQKNRTITRDGEQTRMRGTNN